MAVKYFVGSLSFGTDEQGLSAYFSQFGNVLSVSIIKDRMTGRNKGFGFVTMDDNNSAKSANETELDGRTIFVDSRRLSESDSSEQKYSEIVLPPPIIQINEFISSEFFKYIKENPNFIYEISPQEYERFIAQMVERFGYEVELTKKTRDGGRDIIAKEKDSKDESFYIECKRYARKKMIGVNIIREFHSVLTLDKINRGIIATSSYFTKDSKLLIERIKGTNCEIDMKDFNGVYNWIDVYLDREKNNNSPFVSPPIFKLFK